MKNQLIEQLKNAGYFLPIDNNKAFIYDQGQGDPVVCFHGVPASSFLYRKVIDQLAQNKLRGLSFDLMGLGLSDRPEDFDYSWTGLGNWAFKLLQKLNLGKFHVVLHDIGGPVGCEVIAKMPDQILSVTILNTILVGLPQFKKPFPMYFYEKKGFGELMVATTNAFILKKLMHARGIHKKEEFGTAEAKAYLDLLNGNDKARAFLKIMRSFEANAEKEQLYLNTLKNLQVPIQILWGNKDKGLRIELYGEPLRLALGLDHIVEVSGSHFLQEDYPEAIVSQIIQQI